MKLWVTRFAESSNGGYKRLRGAKGDTKVFFARTMGKAELPSMAELFFFPYAIRSLALNTELYFHTKFLQMTLLLKRSPVF